MEGTLTELLVFICGSSSVGLLVGESTEEDLNPVLTRRLMNQRIVAFIFFDLSAVFDPAAGQLFKLDSWWT